MWRHLALWALETGRYQRRKARLSRTKHLLVSVATGNSGGRFLRSRPAAHGCTGPCARAFQFVVNTALYGPN